MRFSALITAVTHASLCFAFPPSYFERRTTLGTFGIDQLIDVNGTHAFQPPQSGDLRGPCPGLNAMSNHGYIPRNGIVLLADAITQSNKGSKFPGAVLWCLNSAISVWACHRYFNHRRVTGGVWG